MATFVLIVAIVLATGVGMLLIHRVNTQHDARIATHHYSEPLPRPPLPPEGSGSWPERTDKDA
ncbi:hypothetical protein ACIQNG_10350 [Streptomyces sp. NPDC091377]|uniref:hypothetical protein n=1 Tax=unclassified Streptomyces TaxID=2593676 RepID=UPI0037F78443